MRGASQSVPFDDVRGAEPLATGPAEERVGVCLRIEPPGQAEALAYELNRVGQVVIS